MGIGETKMIVLHGLPVPPSVNASYQNRVTRKASGNKSKLSFAISRRKSPDLEWFYSLVAIYGNTHRAAMNEIKTELNEIINNGFVLKVDLIVAIFRDDMLTKGQVKGPKNQKTTVGANIPHGVDANNYVKAAIDGLTKLTSIDDKYILAGTFEKVSCETKELECSTLIIRPHKIRTLTEIKNQIQMELSSLK